MRPFGRPRPSQPLPLSGRYLTRLLLLTGFCIVAMLALNWRHFRNGAGESAGVKRAPIQTAIAPSPFGDLGAGVVIAEDRPQEPHNETDHGAANLTEHGYPAVDVDLLQRAVLDNIPRPPKRPFYHLVSVIAQTPAEVLENQSRQRAAVRRAAGLTDIRFANLWNDPEQFHGELIYLAGHIRGIRAFAAIDDENLNPMAIKTLYQCDLFTDESHPNPYIIVVPELAEGMPIGTNLTENITFAGYFLHLWVYNASGDIKRKAPLLIGRMLSWTPAPRPTDASYLSTYIVVGFVMLLVCVGGAIWALNRASVRQREIRRIAEAASDPQALADLAKLETLDVDDQLRKLEQD